MAAPSVLLVDDGELDSLHILLQQMGVDFVRVRGAEAGDPLPTPRDLLLTSGSRALGMPVFEPPLDVSARPVWVCLHSQDFRPLRERLRARGVHFLIHSRLDPEALRLFLLQLLFRGEQRRRCWRIPIRCEAAVRIARERRKVELAELSRETARVISAREIPSGRDVYLELPDSLAGAGGHELVGRATRAMEGLGRGAGSRAISTVIRFGDIGAEAREVLESILRGERPGTPVSPLAEAPAPGSDEAPGPADASDPEQRYSPRFAYTRRVAALRWSEDEGPEVAVGRDLSATGVRIQAAPTPRVGSRVTLALYGAPREEPIVVEAEVVRVEGDEACLQFLDADPSTVREIEKLARRGPGVEALQEGEDGERVLTRVLDGDD